MKSYRKELALNIPSRRGFVNITRQVEEAWRESGIRVIPVLRYLSVVSQPIQLVSHHRLPQH